MIDLALRMDRAELGQHFIFILVSIHQLSRGDLPGPQPAGISSPGSRCSQRRAEGGTGALSHARLEASGLDPLERCRPDDPEDPYLVATAP